MSQVQAFSPSGVPRWQQHWSVLLTGMGLAATSTALAFVLGGSLPLLRLLLLGSGLILAGQAIVLRLRQGREEVEERVESAAVIALAGFTALIGLWKIEWDSAEMVLKALIVAAVFGTVLVVLHGRARRMLLSFLVLFHFVGVLTTVTMLPPPVPGNNLAPFLANKAWVYVYRHYLGFFYMNNAYHFYSPEPGPPTLLWFKLNYEYTNEKGETAIKSEDFSMPNRKDSPVNLHYQRLLSITENCNNLMMPAPNILLEGVKQRRELFSTTAPIWAIPYHPSDAVSFQYQPPSDWSALLIPGVVRRVAREYARHPKDESARLVSIKLYRVRHNIPPAGAIADGFSPLDPSLYSAYFQGEFFPDGKLVNPTDPYLYWLIPIFYDANDKLLDFVAAHAEMDYNRAAREKAGKENQP